jgi:hypothetical protein
VRFGLEVRAMAIDILDGFWKLVKEIADQVSNERGVKFCFYDNTIGTLLD